MPEQQERYPGRLEQTWIYLGKRFRIFLYENDWKVLPMAAIIACMVAYVVGKNMFVNMEGTKIGSLAFVCVCIWNGFFNSIQAVCKERQIIKREHRAGLHISAYLAAHIIYQIFLCLLQVAIALVIFKFMGVKFPTDAVVSGNFMLDIFITLFLITFASDMLALMVSCIVHTTTTAMTVMPFLLIVQLVFAGVAFPLSGIPSKISNATVSKWGIYAVCTESNYNNLPTNVLKKEWNLVKDSDLVAQITDFANSWDPQDAQELWEEVFEQLQVTVHEKMQVQQYDATKENILKEWGILLGFAALYVLIGTVFLEFIDHDHR